MTSLRFELGIAGIAVQHTHRYYTDEIYNLNKEKQQQPHIGRSYVTLYLTGRHYNG